MRVEQQTREEVYVQREDEAGPVVAQQAEQCGQEKVALHEPQGPWQRVQGLEAAVAAVGEASEEAKGQQ
jgi:hypothetical protein